MRKDRVEAFAYSLSAGTHTFTYKALVVTPGRFAMPPTKAYAVDQPELLGLSGGGHWGSSDPAWASIDVSRTAKVCAWDPIAVVGSDGTFEFRPSETLDKPGEPPIVDIDVKPIVTSASTCAVSSVLVLLAATLLL